MDDFLTQLRALTEGENPVPIELVDGITQEWGNASTALDGAAVTITEKDTAITAQVAEINRLKAANYDLTIKNSAKEPERKPDSEQHQTGIAGLFTRRERQ